MSSDKFANTLQAQEATQKALQRAIDVLASKGIIDPLYTPVRDCTKKYEEIEAYREKLAALTVKYIRESAPIKVVEEQKQAIKFARPERMWND